MNDLSRGHINQITFIICIKVEADLDIPLLNAQIASCLSVSSSKLIIGLNQPNEQIESRLSSIISDQRITLSILNDKSLYDGWNKAVSIAETEYISFLGFGDCVINPRYFESVDLSHLDAVFARALIYSDRGDRVSGRPFNRHLHYWKQMVAMIGAIFRRDIVAKAGFDASLRIVGDYEFLLRVGKDLKAGFFPLTVVSMPSGGLSEGNYDSLMEEVHQVRKKHRRG